MSKKSQAADLKLVSFKLGKDLYKLLEDYAKTQKDEAGVELSPSQAARRLMLEGLRRLPSKKS